MSNPFFEHPILNSPYECPQRHWELDPQGQPTQKIIDARRRAEFITPIPKPKKVKGKASQQAFVFDEGNLGAYGRWAFAEFTEVYQIEADFKAKVESEFNKMIEMTAFSKTPTILAGAP